MATFRKRGKRWQVQVRRVDVSPQSRSFISRQDAEKWARTIELCRHYLGNHELRAGALTASYQEVLGARLNARRRTMDHRELSGAVAISLNCVVAAVILLLVGSADVSNAVSAVKISGSSDNSSLEQPKERERTAQISATVESPQCYENIGCPHKDLISEDQIEDFSCENLWLVRNTIFHQRGYCFQTARGRANFDNSHCLSSSTSELKLTEIENQNVATIRDMEHRKGCH